jgi:hypothetical protein
MVHTFSRRFPLKVEIEQKKFPACTSLVNKGAVDNLFFFIFFVRFIMQYLITSANDFASIVIRNSGGV